MVFFATRGLLTKSYNPVFAENEWSAIIEACHANEVPDEWVADGTCYKDMDIGGANYRIDIIGKNHDDLADGTGKGVGVDFAADAFWFEFLFGDGANNP